MCVQGSAFTLVPAPGGESGTSPGTAISASLLPDFNHLPIFTTCNSRLESAEHSSRFKCTMHKIPDILLFSQLLQLPECVWVSVPRRFQGRKPRYQHGCTQRWTVGFMTQDLDTVASQ